MVSSLPATAPNTEGGGDTSKLTAFLSLHSQYSSTVSFIKRIIAFMKDSLLSFQRFFFFGGWQFLFRSTYFPPAAFVDALSQSQGLAPNMIATSGSSCSDKFQMEYL